MPDVTATGVLPAAELLSCVTQPGLDVLQITTDPEAACNVFYNYHQAFEPTSRFVLLNRTGKAGHELLCCDLHDHFAMEPVTGKDGYLGAAFSPDGQWIWYSQMSDGYLELRRRALTGGQDETVFALPRKRPDFGGRRILGGRWLSFSHDARRLLCVVTLEGLTKYYSVAILTFDLQRMMPHTAFETGPSNWNNKSQYAPCAGPKGEYLIGVGDSYSQAYFDDEAQWKCDHLARGKAGIAEYLVDEGGVVRYAYPVGRDRPHQSIDHWAWFGRSLAKVFHCNVFDTAPHWRGAIMLAEPVPADEQTRHLGRHLPGGRQVELTRHIKRPDVWHICAGWDGRHLVCDTVALGYGDAKAPTRYLYGCTVRHDAGGPYVEPKYILTPYSSWRPYTCECMPCYTPDRRWILFNSDYPGVNGYRGERHTGQVFAVRHFEFPPGDQGCGA